MTASTTARGANPYIESDIAEYYSHLDYGGTYGLAVRDLPDIVARHVTGTRALDFACGVGRSTRFLKSLGFDAVGVDISKPMLAHARRLDPAGEYHLVGDGDLEPVADRSFDLVLSAFPFGNTTSLDKVTSILARLRAVLAPAGRLVVIEATPDLYRHEWLSFSTAGFAENATAASGDSVRVAFRDRIDRPVVDVLWTDGDFRRCFAAAGLRPLEMLLPRGRDDDREPWVSERAVAPWVVYVLDAPARPAPA